MAPNIPNAEYESGGIFWGTDAGNYVKLAYSFNCSALNAPCLGIQFASEVGGAFNGGAKSTNPLLPSFQSSLDLYLLGDPHDPADPNDNTARACYSKDGGALTTIETRAGIPDSFFASTAVYAGLVTSHTPFSPQDGGTRFDMKFDRFRLFRADADGDGYLSVSVCGGTDCDDSLAAVHPGAAEQCNDRDDDCDGSIDEDWSCDDSNACTTDYCSGAVCSHGSVNCDDAIACTYDYCDSATGCKHVPNDALCPSGQVCIPLRGCSQCSANAECSDGLFCNGEELCVSGVCQLGTPPGCDDANPCTNDWCDTGANSCAHQNRTAGTPCPDGNFCNGAETCNGSGTCVSGVPVDCSSLSGPCTTGTCNPSTGTCSVDSAPDYTVCGDDANPCNGDDICLSGACVTNNISVAVATLSPITSSGYRARDIADNDYAPRFYTKTGDPDYTASDYAQAQVKITFKRSGSYFEGHLKGTSLKPNFAYQIKITGMPTREFGTAGDDLTNERIGLAGRWNKVGSGNATDAQYQACKADPNCTDIYQGYLVFGFFLTDRYGAASADFRTDKSLHVLWRDCPAGHTMTGCAAPSGRPTIYQDVIAGTAAGYGYNQDYQTWNIGVFGEVERQPPQAYLPSGEYRVRFSLTEESFHESGRGGYWAAAVGETGIHFWVSQAAGSRDCGDWNVCNGYEACDGGGACQPGAAPSCSDSKDCTVDTCDAKSGCSHTNRTGSCDDHSACTSGDACSSGVCTGTPVTCQPGQTCDPVLGCVGCNADGDCNDGLWCNGTETCNLTNHACVAGTSVVCSDGLHCNGTETCNETADSCQAGTPPACNDGLYCNGTETCNESTDSCQAGTLVVCSDGQYCNGTETCNETTDSCQTGTPPACNDGLYCNGTETCNETTDSCQAGTLVVCSDGQYCNGTETCNETTDSCQTGTPPSCNDMNSATADYCDPVAGACNHVQSFDGSTGVITDSMWVSGMELGGIGDGKMEFRTNGEIGNYTINNNWDREVATTKGTFFAVQVDNGLAKQSRILRRNFSGGSEYSGLDGVDHLRYLGMFPILNADYYDSLPVALRLNAFSPLIPQNAKDSSLPVAFYTFEVTNTSQRSVDVSLAFSWQNILGRGGYDTWGSGGETWSSVNGNYQENVQLSGLRGVRFRTTQSWGTMQDNVVGEYLVLAVEDPGVSITTCNSWNSLSSTPSYWSEFSNSGTLTDPVSPPSGSDGVYDPAGAVAARTSLAPGASRQVRFMVVWFMPTQITKADGVNHGHAYLADPETDTAAEIALYTHGRRQQMLEATEEWQNEVLASNLPFWLKLRMINGLFTMFANTVYPQDLHLYTHESLVSMGGSLGTMDQRMSWHQAFTMLFPALDQSELTVFGDVQPADGAISHLNGNVGSLLHSANVNYGITHWPDLSCSYVMQVLKSYKWTGNASFLNDNWQDVKEAMTWLQNADGDGDKIPEGGSTYDYEGASPGAFIYTATSYLGALKAAEEMARIKGETTLADAYASRFLLARSTVMTRLWTGEYFKKYYRASPLAETQNSFIASLAGDWLSRYSMTGRTLDIDVTKSAENRILNWHQDLFPNYVAPMEVAPDGTDPADNCYQYQHEPYIGFEGDLRRVRRRGAGDPLQHLQGPLGDGQVAVERADPPVSLRKRQVGGLERQLLHVEPIHVGRPERPVGILHRRSEPDPLPRAPSSLGLDRAAHPPLLPELLGSSGFQSFHRPRHADGHQDIRGAGNHHQDEGRAGVGKRRGQHDGGAPVHGLPRRGPLLSRARGQYGPLGGSESERPLER